MVERKIKCPTCGNLTVYSPKNEYRPFCSERCQLRDLGNWAMEKHAIPGDPVEPTNEVNENLEDDVVVPIFRPRH